MYSITDLKKGTLLQIDGVPYRVTEYAQKQMGRGGSIVNTKLKNLMDGTVHAKTFKGAEQVEEADITSKDVQFLYADDKLHFMDEVSYEQFELSRDIVESAELLKEGQKVQAQIFEDRVINIDLPVKVELEVVETPDVVKGDTQSTVMKEAKLESGAEIQVPIFIKQGDIVVVDTRTSQYVERKK